MPTQSDLTSLSLESLIEVSSLLGHDLEDRAWLRQLQDEEIWRALQDKTNTTLQNPASKDRFYYGSIDFLVEDTTAGKKFHPIEFNGTGMGGITNIALSEFNTILHEIKTAANLCKDPNPLALSPTSGTKLHPSSGTINLIYERILCAQALKEGFKERTGKGKMVTLNKIIAEGTWHLEQPTVVIGNHKDFMHYITFNPDDCRLYFLNHPLSASLRDQFCDNLASLSNNQIDFDTFHPMNAIYPMAGDKGLAYTYINQMLEANPNPALPSKILFEHCDNRELLIDKIEEQLAAGQKLVIKPHAAGLGRGIDFFVTSHTRDEIVEKVDASIEAIHRFYGADDSAFPYTVCQFVDSCTINKANHPLNNHRYELRVVIYREGTTLKAFPSMVKISSKAYNAKNPDRWMLLNNVAISHAVHAEEKQLSYMIPLCNQETLNLIDLDMRHLETLCGFSTQLIGHVLTSPAQVITPY